VPYLWATLGETMHCLIDGDIITYRVGFTTQEDEEWVAGSRVDELIGSILADVEVQFNISASFEKATHQVFLTSTDKSNYRFNLHPEYKANRTSAKPIHYDYIREYLVNEWKAEVIFGEEADDALGYSQEKDTIICSIDKDLLMIPGKHYNFVKKEFYEVSPAEALYNFYWQLLNGDTGDNIPGCPGVGPVKIGLLIHSDMEEIELFQTVYETYEMQYKKKGLSNFEKDILRNGRLLKIRQSKEESLWEFPKNV